MVGAESGFFFGRPLVYGFGFDLLDVVRHGGIEFVRVHADLAISVQAAAGGDATTVTAHRDVENTARHRGKFAYQVRVVADAPRCLAKDAIDLRRSVSAADHHFVALGMASDGVDAALKCAWRDGCDVIHEAFRGDLCKLASHIAADGDQVGAVLGENGVQ